MAARYVNITLEEFDAFMFDHHFERIQTSHGEYIYEREFQSVEAKVKVFSSITASGQARKRGGDAIRVVVLYKINDVWRPTGKQRRVHRVENWRNNLDDRIEEARLNVHPEPCSRCDSPMLLRHGSRGSFYSCCQWRYTGCEGKAPVEWE